MPEWEALEDRRAVSIRHARFNAALVTATLMNAHRGADSESISPFDFLAGFEVDEAEADGLKLRKSIKHAIALAFTQMKCKTPAEAQAAKATMIQNMKSSGVADPEELIREVFPDL